MMMRSMVVLMAVLSIGGVTRAQAQETTPGSGIFEITVIPAGTTYFTSGNSRPSFGNYTLGGALTYNINRIVGIEGEVGGSFSGLNGLQFGDLVNIQAAPSTLTYSGNVVASLPTHTAVVPYATAGIGGFTMFQQVNLGINSNDTLLTGNVGGGLKWYAPNGRWGLRGDYRFSAVGSNSNAPAFYGQDTRYEHRVYAGVIINAIR
jgi:Outer membrane protein beta-barrel domain